MDDSEEEVGEELLSGGSTWRCCSSRGLRFVALLLSALELADVFASIVVVASIADQGTAFAASWRGRAGSRAKRAYAILARLLMRQDSFVFCSIC